MSTIREFYQDKTILLTGATGFLGKGLVEKVLRDLPQIRHLYLLVRPRDLASGDVLSAEDRVAKEVFSSNIFARLRQTLDDGFDAFVREKVTAVPGDLGLERLGLSSDWWTRLTDEVNVVINSAALVAFDGSIEHAVLLNTIGPQRIVEFAQACPNAVLLHVSTAYVNTPHKGNVPEQVLPPPNGLRIADCGLNDKRH